MSYAFGDSERAAKRLALVAKVFAPSSVAFIREASRERQLPAAVVDLGCGPGHTTKLLADCFPNARCIGLDASPAYVQTARHRAPGCTFFCHDLLAPTWPTPPPDLLYARFLLTHLADPEDALARFAKHLAAGGLLLVDEVETIESEAPVFQRYLGFVEQVIAASGAELYVGPRIAAWAEGRPRTRKNTLRTVEVAARDAAGMFAMNWQTVRDHEALTARTTPAERDALAAELEALRRGEEKARITWKLRQVAVGA